MSQTGRPVKVRVRAAAAFLNLGTVQCRWRGYLSNLAFILLCLYIFAEFHPLFERSPVGILMMKILSFTM